MLPYPVSGLLRLSSNIRIMLDDDGDQGHDSLLLVSEYIGLESTTSSYMPVTGRTYDRNRSGLTCKSSPRAWCARAVVAPLPLVSAAITDSRVARDSRRSNI